MNFGVISYLGSLFPVIYCCKQRCYEFSCTYLCVPKSSLGWELLGQKVKTYFTRNSKLFFKVVEPVNTPFSSVLEFSLLHILDNIW